MLITVRYLGATSYRRARFIVSNGREKKTFQHRYTDVYPGFGALQAFCKYFCIEKTWLVAGSIKDTHVFVSDDAQAIV